LLPWCLGPPWTTTGARTRSGHGSKATVLQDGPENL